jgi:hypothetical protein
VTDIQVRNCTVRVVRQGGWSWGPDPRGLLDEVLAAVPVLIADALAAAVPDGADAVVHEPVRVNLPLRLADLAALARAGRPGAGEPGRDPGGLPSALAQAVEEALTGRDIAGPAPAASDQSRSRAGPARQPRPPGPGTLRLLLAWERDGLLAGLLERLPEPVLAAWHKAVVNGWRGLAAPAPAGAELAAALAGTATDPIAGPAGELAAWLRRRLAALTVVAARTGLVPCQPEVLAALDDRLGPPPERGGQAQAATTEAAPSPVLVAEGAGPPAAGHGQTAPSGPGLGPLTTAPPPGQPRAGPDPVAAPVPALPSSPAGPAPTWEVGIGSALPFLVLVPLASTGWLDTLAVAVEAAELGGHWPALAAALAYKVLSPPEHGWRRSPEDQATAAAFAGAGEPLVEGALPERAGLLAPPLDAVLARSLVDGHRPDTPLVLVQAGPGNGLVLFDGEGLFPMAWADDEGGLAGWLHECPGARLVRSPETPEAPGDQGGPRDGELLERAGLVLAELRGRPALPLAAERALERSLTLAAGAGLAALALTLWGGREPTDPVLAIERLASLSAVVRDDGERLRVTVPLGARYFDLREHGLLGVVPGPPWLGERAVEIVGG